MFHKQTSCFRNMKKLFMNIKITHKLLIGYFAVVLVPTFLLEWSFYQANYKAFLQNYLLNQEYSLNIAKQNFDIQLGQISSLAAPFENNMMLNNYLRGNYYTVSDSMYNYFQYIKPLYTSPSINPYLYNFTIYSYRTLPLYIPNRLLSIEKLKADNAFIQQVSKNMDGVWLFSTDNTIASAPSLNYYKTLYSSTYPYYLGMIEMKAAISQVFGSFNSLSENDLYLYDENSGLLYRYDQMILTLSDQSLQQLYQNNKNRQTVDLDSISCKMIQINHADSIVSYDGKSLLFMLIILFLLLTVMYYIIASSITGRLKAFNNYVNKIDANQPEEFQPPVYKDELGVVITSHNNMIRRVIQLTNENLNSQIQKRDAEYYALQAQIKPHFLYNMLENIRMSAESHNDPETADMLLSLGKHMRYSLNMKTSESTLENELYFARNYLQMQKTRLKNKIETEIFVLTEIDKIPCPRLALQSLLENSIKHGYRIGKTLRITINVREGTTNDSIPCVAVEINDNGNGIDADTLSVINQNLEQVKVDSNQHVGLNNVNSRLITFFGSKEGRLYISSKPGIGTTVCFYLKKTVS